MTESIKRTAQEFSCDFCGHFSGDHAQRMSDSEQAPCFKCGCEDFQSEAADNAGSDEAPAPTLAFRKVWLVESVEGRKSRQHQPLGVYADEARARDRAEREKPRETVVSWLWLWESR